jgi:hypothetical protein
MSRPHTGILESEPNVFEAEVHARALQFYLDNGPHPLDPEDVEYLRDVRDEAWALADDLSELDGD